MKPTAKSRLDLMGKLNNGVVELIDSSQLTPPEIVIVLESITERIKQLFAISTSTAKEK